MKKHKRISNDQDAAKTYRDYSKSRARYIQQKHEATKCRQRINPRLLILNVDFFDPLEEQPEGGRR